MEGDEFEKLVADVNKTRQAFLNQVDAYIRASVQEFERALDSNVDRDVAELKLRRRLDLQAIEETCQMRCYRTVFLPCIAQHQPSSYCAKLVGQCAQRCQIHGQKRRRHEPEEKPHED